jgi:hypothetical protein
MIRRYMHVTTMDELNREQSNWLGLVELELEYILSTANMVIIRTENISHCSEQIQVLQRALRLARLACNEYGAQTSTTLKTTSVKYINLLGRNISALLSPYMIYMNRLDLILNTGLFRFVFKRAIQLLIIAAKLKRPSRLAIRSTDQEAALEASKRGIRIGITSFCIYKRKFRIVFYGESNASTENWLRGTFGLTAEEYKLFR